MYFRRYISYFKFFVFFIFLEGVYVFILYDICYKLLMICSWMLVVLLEGYIINNVFCGQFMNGVILVKFVGIKFVKR